jgi:hypothetical protein
MAAPGYLSRRAPAEWVVRILLAVGAAWCGYGAVTQSFAYAIRATSPERAHAISAGDGRITALLSELQSGPEATLTERARSDMLARAALRQDPTAVAALATLGLNAQIRGDAVLARQFFVRSERLSRRDLRTRLWAIEDAVARGDTVGALHHYDIALRTSRSAPDLLFPILASAITDPSIRVNLARTLATHPIWADSFISFAAGNAPDPRSVASLYTLLDKAGVGIPDWSRSGLLSRLLSAGYADLAWRYYRSYSPNVSRNTSRDAQFQTSLVTPAPFDWNIVESAGISTSIQRSKDGKGVFDFATSSGIGGPLLRQTQMLLPGDYVIEGHSTGINQAERSRPYWTLECSDGRTFGRFVLPNSTDGNGWFSGSITLPPGCPVQNLTLIARPSEDVSGVQGQIDRIQLRPAR